MFGIFKEEKGVKQTPDWIPITAEEALEQFTVNKAKKDKEHAEWKAKLIEAETKKHIQTLNFRMRELLNAGNMTLSQFVIYNSTINLYEDYRKDVIKNICDDFEKRGFKTKILDETFEIRF